MQDQICVGRKGQMEGFRELGMALNRVGAGKADYLFALYEHTLPDRYPMHGRYQESPDADLEWTEVDKLDHLMRNSGQVDQVLALYLAQEEQQQSFQSGTVLLSPKSRLIGDLATGDYQSLPYSSGRNVFISHASENSFVAFALYRFLLEQSSREILVTIDLKDLPDGERISKLENMIKNCDGVVLVITPSLLIKSIEQKESGKKDWVKWEIKKAQKLGNVSNPLQHLFKEQFSVKDGLLFACYFTMHQFLRAIPSKWIFQQKILVDIDLFF